MGAKEIATGRASAVAVIGLGRTIEIAVNETGLTSSQFRALSLVNAGVTSGSVLAQFLAVRAPTVTTVMNGLVDDGLVARARAEDDRRRVDFELTKAGRAALDTANAAAATALDQLAGALDADEANAAMEGLVLWQAALTRSRES
ncbi:MAG: MarR family transcriptional regulator [Acidimicrobiales bacterium]|jgi:DNA-binding MarR family transcriptional regulator|nr:MarR family transcriptional regulator [Acidimicrobiales bacterium]